MAIDPNIKQKAENIRLKKKGREVRESLAAGLEAMSEDVVSTVARQGDVESQFQEVIDNTTGKDVISAPELIAARNGEANLKARLDKEQQQVNAQLSQILKHVPSFINVLSIGLDNTGLVDNTFLLQKYIDEIQHDNINLYFPEGTYLFDGTVFAADKVINFKGETGMSNILADTSTVSIFRLSGGAVYLNDVRFTTNSNERTEFTVVVENASRLWLNKADFYNHGGKESGLSVKNVTTTNISNSVYNHASISLRTWDVKITNTWVWALWRPYGIGIHGGCGNISLSNVDIVPPFRRWNGDKTQQQIEGVKAGIWINGEGGSVPNGINMSLIYLDGNPTLDTGKGVLIEGSFGVTLDNFRANKMSANVVHIDNCYDVTVSNGIFYENNKNDSQEKEVFVTKTSSTSKHGNILIKDNHIINYQKNITKQTPAILIDPSVPKDTVKIEGNYIGQDQVNPAYGQTEIDTSSISQNSLSTNHGTLSKYSSRNLIQFKVGEKAKTINFVSSGAQLLRKPEYYNVKIIPIGRSSLPPFSLTLSDKSNGYVNFDEVLTKDIDFYIEVEL